MKRILYEPADGPRIAEFVAARIGGCPEKDNFTALGLESDDKVVAGVIYTHWNGRNIVCEIAAEGKYWLTRQFRWYMFWYPFQFLEARRITIYVEQANLVSQQFVTKLGFELEVVMKDAGRTGDMLMYRMFREECRYLERRDAGKSLT